MTPAGARDELIDALCEEGAYSAGSAIYLADQYRDQVLREAAERAESRTEFGVRFEDGLVWPRGSREQAELSARSIQGRHGAAQLVQRQVTVTDWTDIEPDEPARLV